MNQRSVCKIACYLLKVRQNYSTLKTNFRTSGMKAACSGFPTIQSSFYPSLDTCSVSLFIHFTSCLSVLFK